MLARQILQVQLASLRQRMSWGSMVVVEGDDDDFTEELGVCTVVVI